MNRTRSAPNPAQHTKDTEFAEFSVRGIRYPLPQGAHADYVPPHTCVTDRGIAEYSAILGYKSIGELHCAILGKTILDLGCGEMRFAVDVALREIKAFGAPVTRVLSYDTRFQDRSFRLECVKHWMSSPDRSLTDQDYLRLVKAAFEFAWKNRVALSWDRIQDAFPGPRPALDGIFSVMAFPFYSDLSFRRGEDFPIFRHIGKVPENYTFGCKSRKILEHCCRILKPGCEARLDLGEEVPENLQSTRLQQEIQAFAANHGCHASFLHRVDYPDGDWGGVLLLRK